MPAVARRIVKSRSNQRLAQAAAEYISAYSEIVLITPTFSAGEGIAHRNAAKFAGLHRITPILFASDLARPEMVRRGFSPLSTLGLETFAARVIHAERDARALEYFDHVASMPGFARALARTLNELRLAETSTDELAASGAPGKDLARLLKRYEEQLAERSLADLACVLSLASEAAEKSGHRWLGLPLVILDVSLDSRLHRRFFRLAAKRAPAVLAAVSCGVGKSVAQMEEMLGCVAEDLDASAPSSALEHLRRYLFSAAAPSAPPQDAAFQIFSAPGEGLEAVEIARRILKLAEDGVPFDRIAILLRSPERYQPVIEDALRRARIPAYFSRGTARPDPGGRAFLALLHCAAEKCPASRFAEYLSLGQVPASRGEKPSEWVGATDELLSPVRDDAAQEKDSGEVAPNPVAWEKLLVDAAVIGGRDRWERRLRGLEHEFELRLSALEREDAASRGPLEKRLEQLRQFEQFALPLIKTLSELPDRAYWKDWLIALGDLARSALRRPDPVLSVLAEFEPMGDVGPATIDEIADVLSERLRFLRSDAPDRRYGRVMVCSLEEARGQDFPVVFLPGLAEGLFPQRALEDPLLLDDFRRAANPDLPLRDDRALQERERLYLAVAAARDRLIVSYPRMDVAEARPRVPSFYALELPRAMEGALPELEQFERSTRDAAPARLNWPAPRDPRTAIDDAEYDLAALAKANTKGSAQYLMEVNSNLARSLRTRYRRWEKKEWTYADGLVSSDTRTLDALAGQRLQARAWSPSSLQRFAVCPYQFALYGIMELRPREDPSPLEQMDPLTRGGLFHAVQFALFKALKLANALPVTKLNLEESLAAADRVLNSVAAEFAEKLAPAIDRVWRSEIEDIRTDLRGWLQHIALNDDEWIPAHFEFGFGLSASADRDPSSTAEEAELDEGVKLRGSIDLVERHATRGTFRVTDHKTGKPPEKTPVYVGGGLFLQPLLYGLSVEKLLGATVESGRLFYATQRGEYKFAEIPVNPRSRAFLAKLLANLDGSIATAFLPAVPQKDACGYCDFRPVCGPYEELRTAKKNRRDEQLEPLIEIRGFA